MTERKRIAFLVGMPRAATTFLYHNLNRHPGLFIPFRRKTNYFSLHNEKGENWYLSHFKDATGTEVSIDTETLAFLNSGLRAPRRIEEFNPDAKVILCIREPGEWVVSLYKQISTFDGNIPDFEAFLNGGYTMIEDGIPLKFVMNRGDIARRVAEYKQLFRHNLLILKFHNVTEQPLESLRKIEAFLGITPHFKSTNIITKKINASDRIHSKFLGRALRNARLIEFIRENVPRRLVLAIRWTFDAFSVSRRKSSVEFGTSEADRRMLARAREWFDYDIKVLEEFLR